MAAALASRLYSCTVPYNMSSVHHHVLRRIVKVHTCRANKDNKLTHSHHAIQSMALVEIW